MSVVAVLRLPLSVDLSGFVALLRRMQVPHRVSEEAGEQVPVSYTHLTLPTN